MGTLRKAESWASRRYNPESVAANIGKGAERAGVAKRSKSAKAAVLWEA
jgi:hypothetical protein